MTPNVTVILKNPYCHEIYQRNIRDQMRLAFGVRSVVAKVTMSAVVKLAREIDESALDVFDFGMVSHPMTLSRGKLWRAMLSFLSRSADCGMPVDGVSFQEKTGHMVRSMRLIPTNKVSTDNTRFNEAAQEIIFRYVQCKYHTSNDVFSLCKSVHKMATGKNDDELTQLDNKMRIWTRSGKFRKVENPELSMAW